jgi:hypothetical protein
MPAPTQSPEIGWRSKEQRRRVRKSSQTSCLQSIQELSAISGSSRLSSAEFIRSASFMPRFDRQLAWRKNTVMRVFQGALNSYLAWSVISATNGRVEPAVLVIAVRSGYITLNVEQRLVKFDWRQ